MQRIKSTLSVRRAVFLLVLFAQLYGSEGSNHFNDGSEGHGYGDGSGSGGEDEGPPKCLMTEECGSPGAEDPVWEWCKWASVDNPKFAPCSDGCDPDVKAVVQEFMSTCSTEPPSGPCVTCAASESAAHAENLLFEGCYKPTSDGFDFVNEIGRPDLDFGAQTAAECATINGEWRSFTCADSTSYFSNMEGSAFYEHYGITCDNLSEWMGEKCCGQAPNHCAQDQIVHQSCPSAPGFTINDLAHRCIQLISDNKSCNHKLEDGSCGRKGALCNSNECNLHRTCATEVLSQSGCWESEYGRIALKVCI
jgi:hypothetical protein